LPLLRYLPISAVGKEKGMSEHPSTALDAQAIIDFFARYG